MDSDDEDEKEKTKGPKFPIQMYISEGNKHLRLAKYDTAIGFFDEALEREPNNARSFIGRAKCKMRQAKFSDAREDAEAALKINPKSNEAKLLIGEADYFLGDFEKGFLTFRRGHLARPNCVGLKLGHQMCMRAIDNSLQPDKPIIIQDQEVTNLSKVEDEQYKEQISKLKTKKDFLTPDLDFVKTLLNDDSLGSVHPHCEYLKMYLRDRQIFWRTQNPDTSRVVWDSNTEEQKSEDDQNVDESLAPQTDNVEQDTASEKNLEDETEPQSEVQEKHISYDESDTDLTHLYLATYIL